MQATQTPGAAVAIVVDTQLVWLRGYGLRQLGVPDSVDAHTVFRIGSLSKGFAGVLTGILVQEGLLRWEEPVQKHFPEFTLRDRKQAARIQLWHLLSHTTGLPYHAYTNLIEEGYDIRRIITQYFPKAPVSGREGVFFSYQNAAFCAIEEVVAKATGRSYATLIREKIFQPAGMHHASTDFSSIQNSPNRALPHFWTGQQWRPDNISPLYYNSLAAGGVNASISDMGAWLRLLLGQRPQAVQESTLDRVFRPVVKTGKERRIMPHWIDRDAAAYAMGWRVLQHGADTLLYHGGYVNGFRGEIALNRRDKVGICVLFNGSSELANHCIEAFFERWEQ
jgi:beta-lactamase class C